MLLDGSLTKRARVVVCVVRVLLGTARGRQLVRGARATCRSREPFATCVCGLLPVTPSRQVLACALVFALRSVIAAMSRRTSSTMVCSRSLLRRCRTRSTRWFALRATRQTNANDTHVFALLRAILCMRARGLPRREVCTRLAFLAVAARPVIAELRCACSTAASRCISGLPRCCRKIGLRLRKTASDARPFGFACQAHAVKAALSVPMLLLKVRLCIPPLADVALPRRPGISIGLRALSTHSLGIAAFPLPCGECIGRLSLRAGTTRPFFTIFGQ